MLSTEQVLVKTHYYCNHRQYLEIAKLLSVSFSGKIGKIFYFVLVRRDPTGRILETKQLIVTVPPNFESLELESLNQSN